MQQEEDYGLYSIKEVYRKTPTNSSRYNQVRREGST